jgi:hypothetical protein
MRFGFAGLMSQVPNAAGVFSQEQRRDSMEMFAASSRRSLNLRQSRDPQAFRRASDLFEALSPPAVPLPPCGSATSAILTTISRKAPRTCRFFPNPRPASIALQALVMPASRAQDPLQHNHCCRCASRGTTMPRLNNQQGVDCFLWMLLACCLGTVGYLTLVPGYFEGSTLVEASASPIPATLYVRWGRSWHTDAL